MDSSLFKERKFPFVLAFSVLLITVTVYLLTTNSATTTSILTYFQQQQQQPEQQIQPQPPIPSTQHITAVPPPPPPKATAVSPPPVIINKSPAVSPPPSPPIVVINNYNNNITVNDDMIKWEMCKGPLAVDYIPCLDNLKAIKQLKSRKRMEHRERHCPVPAPKCLVPLPVGYKLPVRWPKSRDMIWYDNVPHPKLVDYKKEQNWVRKSGDYFVFPGGGTQFKDGVTNYIDFIEKTLPTIQWGKIIRVVLDVGCGVASFGGYLLDKNVITMSLAPKDEHEAQIQFALERGIPATLSVIGTQKLTFPDDSYDLVHCARCRVHWDGDGGKPLLELNRILRPGGFFVWSATPVYRDDEKHRNLWNSMLNLTESMCWKILSKTKSVGSTGVGLVIYQKPFTYSCYEKRKENKPPLCDQKDRLNSSWYSPLKGCISRFPFDGTSNMSQWPRPWPERLSSSKPLSLPTDPNAFEAYKDDTKHWSALVANVYLTTLPISWSSVRNVMDMNASYGGFAAALVYEPVWVMNVVPIDAQDTLSIIFDRGLIGTYHDWCESVNTYPRTYDLLHSSFLFKNLTQRCNIEEVAAEMDRILRPGGYLLVQDTMEMINKLTPILRSLHWTTDLFQNRYLVGKKGFWRPTGGR